MSRPGSCRLRFVGAALTFAVLSSGVLAACAPAENDPDGSPTSAADTQNGAPSSAAVDTATQSSPGPDVVQANSQAWVSTTRFTGTQEEYVTALQACMGDKGFETVPGEEPGQLDIGMEGHSDDQVQEAMETCKKGIGEPNANLTRTDLQDRYDWRLDQFNCLVKAGYVTGSPKSFESFVADYQRTGFAEWDPLVLVGDDDRTNEALHACPRADSW